MSGEFDRRLILGAVVLGVVLLGGRAMPALAQEQQVVAVGRATGEDLRARDEAKADAKRNAVEQACGTLINAQSQVEDFALKKDRILGQAVGYITGFEVRREWVEEGIAHCEILATVAVDRFRDDWRAMFAHLRTDMANPRCMIVITEDNDVDDKRPARPGGVCQSTIEKFFLQHDVQLMDKAVQREVRERDLDLAATNGDVNALAARAAAFGADVLVFGRAEAKRGGTVELAGQQVRRWDVSLNVRVVQADSAQVLVADTYRPQKPYQSAQAECGDEAFVRLAEDAAEQLLHDVGAAWQKRLTSHQIVRLELENCSRSDFREKILPALAKVRGVQQGTEGVILREVVNNVVSAEINWAYDLNGLADALEKLEVEGMRVQVVEQSTNRLRCKIATAP